MPTQLNPATSAIPVVPVANAADATGNYVVPGTSLVAIRVVNGSGVTVTVTVDDPNTVAPEGAALGAAYPDAVFTVAAGAARYLTLTRARKSRFMNSDTGRVSFTIAPVTSVTVEVVAL